MTPVNPKRTRKGTDPGIGSQPGTSSSPAPPSAEDASPAPKKQPRPKTPTRRGAPVTLPRPQRTPPPDSSSKKRGFAKSAKALPADLETDADTSVDDLDVEVDINLDSLNTLDPELAAETVVDQVPVGFGDMSIPVTKESPLPGGDSKRADSGPDSLSPFDDGPEKAKPRLSADELAAIFARPTSQEETHSVLEDPPVLVERRPPAGRGRRIALFLGALCIAALGGAAINGILTEAPGDEGTESASNPIVAPEPEPEPTVEPEPTPAPEEPAAPENVEEPAQAAEAPAGRTPAEARADRGRLTSPTTGGEREGTAPAERPIPSAGANRGFSVPGQGRGGSAVPTPTPQMATPSPMAESSGGLSRGQVRAGMQAVQGRVRACGNGQAGQVTVSVRISPTGRVAHARVTGYFASRPEGSCIARAVRSAQFPNFSGDHMTVRYQFSL